MIIKFFSNYDSSKNLLKRFLANYSVWDDLLAFTIAEDYDFAVVFNSTLEFILPNAKIITIIQEPSWSYIYRHTRFLTDSDYLIIHDPELFEKIHDIKLGGIVIESPAYLFYHDRVDKTFFHYAGSTKKIKKLSMIIGHQNKSAGIYRQRFDLVNKILASDLDIDIYGRRLTINDPRFKGHLDYKFTGLLPYEYSIAVENTEEKNYITEKFVDCVLCNTIPIYHGAPNVAEVYDSRYFRTIDLNSRTIIDDIKKLIAEPVTYSTVNKNIYFHKFNLYSKLKEIILNH